MKTKNKRIPTIVVAVIVAIGLYSCNKDKVALPTVKLFEGAITINYTSASVSAEVTDQGGAEVISRGFAYGKSGESMDTVFCGSGTGVYSGSLNNLEPNTTYVYEAFAKNAGGTGTSGKVAFTTRDHDLPIVKTGEIENVGSTTATCGGNVTNDGGAEVTERGLCWSTSHNPSVGDSHVSSGNGLGEFNCNLTTLTANTTYYVRAYAKNSKGTGYGEEKEFTTLDYGLPTVITGDVTEITQTSAIWGGNVTDDGGSEVIDRGICWSTNTNPTINENHVASGSGIGSFTCSITGLNEHTTYYVRAYACNSKGTSYGEEKVFNTSANKPTVLTGVVANITTTSAIGSGNVISDGGSPIIERGLCWSANHEPTIDGLHATTISGTGEYTVSMTHLTAITTYYVRAYAINSVGTSYGEEVPFTTLTISVPGVITSSITNIGNTSATGGGNVISDGGATVTERGICWSTSHNPTISGNHVAASGTGTGEFTVNMTNLAQNTTYYVRAYAINNQGTAYGDEVSFTTSQTPSYTVSVSSDPTNGGSVSGGGTYQQGQMCTVNANAASGYVFINWTEGGTQVSNNANYTFNVTGNRTLVAHFEQKYTITVYANPDNAGSVSGNGTYNPGQSCTVSATAYSGYAFVRWRENGAEVSTNPNYTFIVNSNRILVAQFTAAQTPSVTTNEVTDVTQTSATCGGYVSTNGGGTVTARGVCWSTNPNPTINNQHTTNGSGTGSFTSSITGLTAGTTYYVRAYATNSAGTGYGTVRMFTTVSATKYAYACIYLSQGGYVKYLIDNPYNAIGLNPNLRLLGGDYYNGYLYAYGYTDPDDKYYFYKINAESGSIVSSYYVGPNVYCSDCAFDYTTNRLYGSKGNDLYTINLSTGAQTYVGSFGIEGSMVALFCNGSGQLYGVETGVSNYGRFHHINKSTGSATMITTLNYYVNYAQSGGFDLDTGTLYWVGYVSDSRSSGVEHSGGLADSGSRDWYGIIATINPNNGSVTVLYSHTGEQCAWSLR